MLNCIYPASRIRLSKIARDAPASRAPRHGPRWKAASRCERSLYKGRTARGGPGPLLVSGGDSGARTRSLRLAKPALSQLSYIPGNQGSRRLRRTRNVVGLGGLEPPTSRLSGVRSNQLSYGPTGRASMGGSARGPGSLTPAPGAESETQEAAAARERRHRGFSSKLQKERLRIAHGLENPEVDLRD